MDEKYSLALVALAYKEATQVLLSKLPPNYRDEFLAELEHQLKTIKLPYDEGLLEDLIPPEIAQKLKG